MVFQGMNQSDCRLAQRISTSSLIQTIRILHIVASLFGFIASIAFLYVLASRSAHHLHLNVRISLSSLSTAAALACAQLLLIAVYGLSHATTKHNPCEAVWNTWNCGVFRFPLVCSVYAMFFGIFAIAIERTIATVKYRTYEVQGSIAVGVALVIMQWTLALAITAFGLLWLFESGNLHFCTVYVTHPRTAVVTICLVTAFELGTLILFTTLLHVNQRKRVNEFVNNALHTLTERYQLQENIRMMQILIPTITVHALLSLAGLLALLIFELTYGSQPRIVVFAPFSEVVMLVIPTYAVVFPLVAVIRNAQFRQAARKALPFLFNERPPPAEQLPSAETAELMYDKNHQSGQRTSRQETLDRESDKHFGLLTEMWKK